MALVVHFLNVGHGDCTIIEHPSGRITMVDINNSKTLPADDVIALAAANRLNRDMFRSAAYAPRGFRSWEAYYASLLDDPVEYFRRNFVSSASVFRYIQSHPDMDHMSGLHRFFWQEEIRLENMWNIAHSKEINEDECDQSRYDYLDWLTYKCMSQGVLQNNSQHKVLDLRAGTVGHYFVDDNISILSPTERLRATCDSKSDWNNLSYVLRITHAGRSIVLPGDAESLAWDEIVDRHDLDEIGCDVLKASHHGRESGYSEIATALMSPSFVVCSVGKKPDTDASDEYKSHGAAVLSTRFHGTITVRIDDDGSLTIRNHCGDLIGSKGVRASWLTV